MTTTVATPTPALTPAVATPVSIPAPIPPTFARVFRVDTLLGKLVQNKDDDRSAQQQVEAKTLPLKVDVM